MTVALAMPPPSHIVCNPYRPPRCSNALTNVVMMRARRWRPTDDHRDGATVHVRLGQVGPGVMRPGQHDRTIRPRLVSIRKFSPCPPLPFRPERASDLKLPCPHILTDLENRCLVLWL